MNKQLSVIVLTKNEEIHLPACLGSLKDLNADIYVVDSGSQDKTVEVAQSYGAQVFSHPFINYAAQSNWAIENLPIQTPWCMRLDADERLTKELVEEINLKLATMPTDISGLIIKIRIYFYGRWIKHGDIYPLSVLRIWRTGKGFCENRMMDEHIVLKEGKEIFLEQDIIHENFHDIKTWVYKHVGYAAREIEDMKRGKKGNEELYGQASKRRWFKENIYWKGPLFIRVSCYWCWRYFFRLGFLDGREGMIFHFMQGLWYRFLVDIMWMEYKRKEKSDHAKS